MKDLKLSTKKGTEMSKIGQSIIDTPIEDELDAAYTLEPITPEDEAEAMEAQAIWSATTTLKDYLWEVNVVLNAVRYSALYISKVEPDHRVAVAAVATAYNFGIEDTNRMLDAVIRGQATVLSHKPTIHNEDTIKENYIPF